MNQVIGERTPFLITPCRNTARLPAIRIGVLFDKVYRQHYASCRFYTNRGLRTPDVHEVDKRMKPEASYAYAYPHPAVSTDIVVFTVRDARLHFLSVRRARPPFENAWALPGGFVQIDEALDASAARALKMETGVSRIFLEQLYTFGRPDRDPRERVISVGYYALLPSDKLRVRAGGESHETAWFSLDEPPGLAFDHADIVAAAHQRLVAKLDYSTIAFEFMPKQFTLSQLQEVYEILLNEPLDKRNFRKKILSLELLEETGRLNRNGNYRPAREYRLKNRGRIDIIK